MRLPSNQTMKPTAPLRSNSSQFATDPCRSIFKRVASIFDPRITDNGNVNVSRMHRT